MTVRVLAAVVVVMSTFVETPKTKSMMRRQLWSAIIFSQACFRSMNNDHEIHFQYCIFSSKNALEIVFYHSCEGLWRHECVCRSLNTHTSICPMAWCINFQTAIFLCTLQHLLIIAVCVHSKHSIQKCIFGCCYSTIYFHFCHF